MISAAEYTNQGGREVNEDCCCLIIQNQRLCAAVADGLGGHGGGDVASSTAVDVVCEEWRRVQTVEREHLSSWFSEANAAIYAKHQDGLQMKTTLAVMICEETKVQLAHVGDTRIYHFIDGRMQSMTFDHSVSQLAVLAGEITQEQIRNHADRNRLIRSLGKKDEVEVELSESIDVSDGRHAFLLCTDGFWEYVLEEEMERLLCKAKHPDEWLDEMVKLLKKKASKGNDNYTAVAVWIFQNDVMGRENR